MVGCRIHFFDVVQAIALDFASWRRTCKLIPSQTASARSSMDRASDYGSEGWGFESLRARSGPPRCDPPVGVLHFYQALLRECFFHAHLLVVVPATRLPVRSEMKVPRQEACLTGDATELARHGSFRAAPRQSSPCSSEMGRLGPLTRRSAGVRAIYRVGSPNNGVIGHYVLLEG